MESPVRRLSSLDPEPLAADQRTDAKLRRRMSPAALRGFWNIASAWKLSNEEQRALLGWPAESTFFKYKAGHSGVLSYDTLMRISLVLGIYKDLCILYPEHDLAHRWIKLPNSNPMFGGQPVIAFMTEGGMDALYQVRRLLDGRRGGWN